MKKVLLSRNYTFPDLKRQTPGCTGVWNGLEFSEEFEKDVDYVVVLNQPAKDIDVLAKNGGSWLLVQEPPYEKKDYLKYHFRFVSHVISDFDEAGNHNERAQASLPWHVGKTYDDLTALSPFDVKKIDKVSWITSNNNLYPGHGPRLGFIKFLKEQRFEFDLFGRGFNPIGDKFDGIAPYKYSIAVENYSAPDYWTEKAIDCMLSWTIPIYHGCTNFSDYFPKGSFVQIDINNQEESLDKMKQVISEDMWSSNIEALRESRDLILNKYQLFPMISERIAQFERNNPASNKVRLRIPKSGNTAVEEFKKRVRNFFGR